MKKIGTSNRVPMFLVRFRRVELEVVKADAVAVMVGNEVLVAEDFEVDGSRRFGHVAELIGEFQSSFDGRWRPPLSPPSRSPPCLITDDDAGEWMEAHFDGAEHVHAAGAGGEDGLGGFASDEEQNGKYEKRHVVFHHVHVRRNGVI